MWHRGRFLLFLVMWCLGASQLAPAAWDQRRYASIIPQKWARQAGLTRSWTAHVELDRARGRVGCVAINVSDSRTFTVVEVQYDDRKTYFSQRDLGLDGKPLGLEGAQRLAQNLIETQKALGRNVTLEKRTIPEVTLYVQTDRGGLQAIDGETGRTRWAIQVGRTDMTNTSAAASDQFVAMINGSQLYLFGAEDGRERWSRRLAGMPVMGPAVGAQWVYVPTIGGTLEAYPVDNPKGTPGMYQSGGEILARPTVSPLTVSWPTEGAYLYMSPAESLQPQFRLEARRSLVSSSSRQSPHTLFVASLGGQVYSLDENDGSVLWVQAKGEPISRPPVPIGDALYVVTDHAGMYSMSAKTGEERWQVHGIRQFVASSNDRVYCETQSRRIVALDARTGVELGSFAAGLDLIVTNGQTDRLYLGTTDGTIQCLHEATQDWPLRHTKEEVAPQSTSSQPAAEAAPDLPPVETGQPNPPAGDVFDPFGAEPTPPTNNQPAAGGNSPDADQLDPFGDLGGQ